MNGNPDAKIIYTGPSPRGWHRLQLAAECLQKYAWTYEVPKPKDRVTSAPLAKGSLIHLALAQHYARMRAGLTPDEQDLSDLGGVGDNIDDWVDPARAVDLISQLEGTQQYAGVALDAYHAYVKNYPHDATKWKILEVEEIMEVQIAGRYRLTGRADLVIEDLGGRVWVVDHKSTARLTARHKQFYSVSGQLLGYSHMGRQKYGDRFAGLIVNLIQHGTPKFERIVLPRSPNLEAKFERIVVDIEESVERIQAEGRDPSDWPKAINELTCYHRYGACDFIDQCRWGAGAGKAGNWSWEDQ